MAAKILFVDDDPNILAGFTRKLRKNFSVETAMGGEDGLGAISEKGPFSVIVSDLRMPGMDGIEFLNRARLAAPDSARILLSGNADLQTAIEAVNRGYIFRLLTKPCEPQTLIDALTAGIGQNELICAERELLEKTLRGTLEVLVEILQLTNPEAFGRATRITDLVKKIARAMQAPDLWQIETAAHLSQIGCVILSDEAIKKSYRGEELTGEEKRLLATHPVIASELLSHIPRMKNVAKIISDQERSFQDTGDGKVLPGSRILKAVLDLDRLHSTNIADCDALVIMASRAGRYDPNVLAALQMVLDVEPGYEKMSLSLHEVKDGMILDGDLFLRDGRLLVAKGYRVSMTLRERMKNFLEKPGIREPVRVLVPSAMAKTLSRNTP
ncbi:MAG: response regulator [Syntrophobacteraceae bacterium]|nr:response regulator [Syntrophobacteraceae bacterium]